MRGLLILFALLCVLPMSVDAAEVDVQVIGVVESDVPAAGDPNKMSRRERRKLGLTFRNVARAARELKREGDDVTALAVMEKIVGENAKAYAETPGIDFDAILEFIQKLLDMLLKYLPLFLEPAPAPGDVGLNPFVEAVQ